MGFVLRKEGDSENPTLATVFGYQITEGMLVYWITENGITKCIIFLGEGEMDGINRFYFQGEQVPEFGGNGQRIWRFHSGKITSKPVYKSLTIVSGNNIGVVGSTYAVNDRVAFSGDLTATFPASITPHKAYYVTFSDGNSITVSETQGGSAVNPAGLSIGNTRVYKADAGFFDPEQGSPEFFPDLDYTFSGIAYIEINMTAEMSAIVNGEEPSGFKFMVRGKRIQDYTSTGLLADQNGNAYPDQNNLPSQTKFFSANNALIALDIMFNKMNMSKSRIDFPSFAVFRDRCKGTIAWDSGDFDVNSTPTFNTLTNITQPILGGLYKSGGAENTWDSSATTQQSITSGNLSIEGIYRGGQLALGFANGTTYENRQYHAEVYDNGTIFLWSATDLLYVSEPDTCPAGSLVKLSIEEINGSHIFAHLYVNGRYLKYHEDLNFSYGTGLRGFFSAYKMNSRMEGIRMFPMSGTARNAERYNAHIVFPTETPASVALEQLFSRAPGCHWQDTNGQIKFIAYPDAVPVDQYSAGKRAIVKELIYDPKMVSIKSNIVQNTYSHFFKPPEEKVSFHRIEYRDLDDEFYAKNYSVLDRPKLRDQTQMIIDSGLIPIGVASKSLADRIGETALRVGSDLDLFIQIKGMPSTYEIAKGDVVYLAHEIPDWDVYNSKLFIVNEEIFESTVNGQAQKSFVLQIYRPDFYSDTAHGEIQALLSSTSTNTSFSKPPAMTNVALTEEFVQAPNGVITPYIKGVVSLDLSYNAIQRIRVYHKHQDDVAYRDANILVEQATPSTPTVGFEIPNVSNGINNIKIVTESVSGLQSDSIYTADVNISETDSSDPVIRSGIALDPNGVVMGRDRETVPPTVINAVVDTAILVNDTVITKIAGEIANQNLQTSHADSVYKAKVTVYNKFGQFVKEFQPSSFNGAGAYGDSSYPYKYADPKEEAFFKIQVLNYWGWSTPIYLKGSTKTIHPTLPPVRSTSNCPLNLTGTAISGSKIQLTYQFGAAVNVWRRWAGQDASQWVFIAASHSASPYNATGLSEGAEYEFKVTRAIDNDDSSNIIRIRTRQNSDPPLDFPAPTGLGGNPNAGSPTTAIDISWSRNSTSNLGAHVYLNGVFHSDITSPTQTNTTITGLTSGTAYNIKVLNYYHDGTQYQYSDFSNEVSLATEAVVVSASPPDVTYVDYTDAFQSESVEVTVYWNINGTNGANYFDLDARIDGGGWFFLATPSNIFTSYTYTVFKDSGAQKHIEYRLRLPGEGNPYGATGDVWIPAYDTWNCFTGDTMVLSSKEGWQSHLGFFENPISSLQAGDYALAFKGNEYYPARINELFVHEADYYLEIVINGRVTKVTPEHPFYIGNKFERIGNLKVGDTVETLDGTFPIDSIQRVDKKITVYNINVEKYHTYIANGNKVHNIKAGFPN